MAKDIKKEFIEKIKEQTKDGIPSAHIPNSMTTPSKPYSFLWRPNNYRRQMRVGVKTNSTLNKIRGAIAKLSIGKHNNLLTIKNYRPNITIQYGRETLTGIWKQSIITKNIKQTYFIEADSTEELDKRINHHRDEIVYEIDEALLAFSRQFKILLPFEKIIWTRHEDWIKGEDYIDKIPEECIIHDTVFKKVYGQGIEFIGGKEKEGAGGIKNYIKNRVIEDFSPQIAEAIKEIVGTFRDSAIEPLTAQIELHLEVQRETLKTLKQMQEHFKPDKEDKLKRAKESYKRAFGKEWW